MKINLRVLLFGAVVLFALSVVYLSKVYASLTVAFVLAYLLDPIVEKIAKKGVPRDLGVLLVLVLFFTFLILTGVAIVPKIIAQAQELIHRLPKVYYSVSHALTPVSMEYLGYDVFHDVTKLVDGIENPTALVKPLGGILQGVFAQGFKLVTQLLGLLIIPLLAFYVLREYPRLYKKFLYLVPNRHQKLVTRIRDRLDGVLGGFIRGQLVVSSILSVYYILALSLLKIELSLVLGLMAGFFNVVPYLGIVSVLILTLLTAVIHGAGIPTFIGIGVVFAIGMATEGSFLTPRIVGRKVGLGPLTLILALLIGGELLGLVGMLLAVPLAAIAKVFLDVFVESYRNSEAFKRA